jgi:DNA-binding MarR family transcriptional regulator
VSAPEQKKPAQQRELLLERFLPYRLAILSHSVSNSIATVYARRFGLTIPEWRVIVILGRFPGLSAVEVAERTLMDKVAVSRAVTRLIKKGRIDRQFADADRRRSILTLSEQGQEVLKDISPLALGIEDMLLDGLSDDEIATLNRVMDRLLEKAEHIAAPAD